MDIIYTQPLKQTSYQILRQAGYIPIFDKRSGKQSYVFRIQQNRYPRFHIYVQDESDNRLKLHLHLDYREHGWGQRLHDTEYDGEHVEAEGARIKRWLEHFRVKDDSNNSDSSKPKKKSGGFLKGAFG